jgi:hypothetical protein
VPNAHDTLDVSLSPSFYLLVAIAGIGSFGILAVVLFLIALWYPRRLDRDGVVTRGGRRHEWRDLERTKPLRGDKLHLVFRTGKVIIVPTFLADPRDVLDFLRRCRVELV